MTVVIGPDGPVVNDRNATSAYEVYPRGIQTIFGGNDKLYLLWTDINGGILMYREPPPTAINSPSIATVVNGATFQPGIVAGSWTTITGVNLSGVTRLWADADFNNGIGLQVSSVGGASYGLPGLTV